MSLNGSLELEDGRGNGFRLQGYPIDSTSPETWWFRVALDHTSLPAVVVGGVNRIALFA